MVALALAASVFGGQVTIADPRLLAFLGGGAFLAQAWSAYLLLAEFVRSRTPWLLFVGAACLTTAALTIPFVMASASASQGPSEIGLLLRSAFPALVIAGALAGRLPDDVFAKRRWTVLVIVAAVMPWIAPALVVPHLGVTVTSGTKVFSLALVVALDVAALATLYLRTRLRTTMAVCLFVALVALSLDTIMSTLTRYSYGWYAGKAFFVVASTVVLAGFIGETRKLRTKLRLANEAVKLTREREHHLAQERLQSGRYDELTGLANRTHAEERLGNVARLANAASAFGVLFVNLDRFKDVNDQFGRGAADLVLVAVASRLAALVGPDATVSRYSGDEFLVVAPSVSSVDHLGDLGEAVRTAISAPIDIPNGTVRLTGSVGMAMFPGDGTSVAHILESADAAARHAKRTGGNKTSFYSRDLFEEARERRRLQEELSVALLRDQFVLHYQPIVDLRSGKVVKAEALIRWMHPERGVVGPNKFIPIAEQSGLMELIGYWVIEEAARQSAAWSADGVSLRIAVNVSARQLDDAGFLPHLTETLERAGVSPQRLELEITETAAMTDASVAQDVLERCRALGLSVSLDDFGTYYSSLTYLKRLPIDNVKIDRSFVQGLPLVRSDAAIVSGILGLARALDRTVIAEGVENEAQREWLVRAGCELGQGYLFGRPMSAAEVCRRYAGGSIALADDVISRRPASSGL
ncbi:MAG TPA: EAL domain-containing protein [Candidatus Elarobacter sp.]|jgi:diguanylate cyclase (GGDEF)-like protein|nr:EAL domain-containing protein [Candidatus Elarobacter sp.]